MAYANVISALKERPMKTLTLLYAVLFGLSLMLLAASPERTVLYYIVIAALATVVMLQIMTKEHTDTTVVILLLQIMFLMLNVLWGATLKYYYYIGYTDILDHTRLMNDLLTSGYVTEAFGIYMPFALWHILCDYLLLLTGLGLPVNKIAYITCGLIFAFVPPAIYLVSERLLKHRKIALLSALVVVFYPILITYGMYSIPRSVCSFLFIVLFWLLLESPKHIKYYLLALLATLAIIIYHTVSIPYVLVMLLLMYLLYQIFAKEEKSPITYSYLIIASAMTLLYWVINAQELVRTLLVNIMMQAPIGAFTKSIYTAPLNELFNYLQYSPTVLFVILATLIVIGHKKIGTNVKILCLEALLLVPVAFPGPLMMVNKLSGNFNFQRFEEYTFLFVGIVAAIGLYYLYTKVKTNVRPFLILLFAIWVVLSVSNDRVALDNPIVKRPFYTFYVTEEETTSIQLLNNMKMDSTYMLSDYITVRYLESLPTFDANYTRMLQVYNNERFLTNRSEDVILIRDGELKKRPMQLYYSPDGEFSSRNESLYTLSNYYYRDNPVFSSLASQDKIFSSKTISAYTGLDRYVPPEPEVNETVSNQSGNATYRNTSMLMGPSKTGPGR
ncbi:hypothetical protein [Methanocella arvoryzae]|uniref:Glycosyltransferase RgtA/B/C/D-like domain-containing protein n=1 Tax=Methanocella arvoryzae (strain DSM 22066 / NBRC 105507 / MRE50) TaxID=351160 RepID=Q0W7B8_METAR|nr:hypothetical protein [Methanocella arvoryzae]CAH04772.1 conserved hypothetical protein [uncultured archaeon]CAJ35725.1 conserved hypothetical protein [Methanocella arvoryzae MRE50]